jgi:hypothetical protein
MALPLRIDGAALTYYEQQSDVRVPVACSSNVYAVHDATTAAQASALADGLRTGYADARSDEQHARLTRILHLQLDYSPTSALVTEQLSDGDIGDVLQMWPCVLQLPPRPHPASREILLPAASVVVAAMQGPDSFQYWVRQLAPADCLRIVQQLDTHVKAVVKHCQLSMSIDCEGHLTGVEDVSMVVDGTAHMSARLPVALETLRAQNAGGPGAGCNTDPAAGASSELRTSHPQANRVVDLLSGIDQNGTLGIICI